MPAAPRPSSCKRTPARLELRRRVAGGFALPFCRSLTDFDLVDEVFLGRGEPITRADSRFRAFISVLYYSVSGSSHMSVVVTMTK